MQSQADDICQTICILMVHENWWMICMLPIIIYHKSNLPLCYCLIFWHDWSRLYLANYFQPSNLLLSIEIYCKYVLYNLSLRSEQKRAYLDTASKHTTSQTCFFYRMDGIVTDLFSSRRCSSLA